MKKAISGLLCMVMVCSMSLPVFGFTVHPVDMSKVDVAVGEEKLETGTTLVDGEEIEYGKVYQGDGFTFEFIKSEDIFSPELIEKEKQMLEEGGGRTYNLPKGFSDISKDFWAYDAIMNMTEMGLFAGTTPPDSNGMGTFNPHGIMTKAQFITVISRALFGTSVRNAIEGEYWFTPHWEALVEYSIIEESDFGGLHEFNKPISREEMAYIILNTLSWVEYIPENTISKSDIPDSYAIESRYIDEVLSCYSMGIICGVDSKGTFSPKGAVNRAQGATILYRMINPEVRIGYVPTPPKPIIDVKDNLAVVSQSSFEDYNDKTVTGTMVNAAIKNFAGKSIAILINTKATGEGVTPDKNHPTIQYLRASDMSSTTNTGSIIAKTTGSKPFNTRAQYGEFYINYNALFEFTPYSIMYFKDGTYIVKDVKELKSLLMSL